MAGPIAGAVVVETVQRRSPPMEGEMHSRLLWPTNEAEVDCLWICPHTFQDQTTTASNSQFRWMPTFGMVPVD